MKKIFGVTLAWILFATVSFSQEATVATEKAEKAATCVPTKECAEKHGMTLEECIKACADKKASTAAATNVASASLVADTKEAKAGKACASKAGMTSAECKKVCSGKSKTASTDETTTTKVASAVMVKDVETVPAAKATAKKSCSSTCTKKKQ